MHKFLSLSRAAARHWKHDLLEAKVDRVSTDAGGHRAVLGATLHEHGNLLDGDRLLESSTKPYSVEYELRRDAPGSAQWRITAGRVL